MYDKHKINELKKKEDENKTGHNENTRRSFFPHQNPLYGSSLIIFIHENSTDENYITDKKSCSDVTASYAQPPHN